MKISVCIPMYNEAAVIEATARKLYAYMEEHFKDEYEIVFTSDGSSDGCDRIVESLGFSTVRVIAYTPNRGKGYAVRKGLMESRGDVALFTDADLAYGTEVIDKFYKEFEKDPSIGAAIGSRNLSKDGYEGYTFIRKLASKTYLKVLAIVGGLRLSDSQCGCKAFSREAINKIFPHCEVDRFAFDFEAILWAQKFGIKMKEVPVKVINHGESKVRLIRDTLKMLRDLTKMRRRIRKASV